MKNFLILGLLAALLFSVSAGMSLWLNQSRQPSEPTNPGDKAGGKPGSRSTEPREQPEPRTLPKTEPRPLVSPETDSATLAVLRDREARLERRAAQVDLILKDLQSQREGFEATLRQISAELKTTVGKAAELEAFAAELRKKVGEHDAAEAKNIDKMAAVYDTMAAESAAPILKQMSENGRMDTAARILAKMKERNAAAVLAALADPALAAQLLDKMRVLRAPAPAPAPLPGGPVLPARGPS